MEELSFYDMKLKKKIKSNDYRIVTKGKRRFAVAKGEKGNECWRVMKKA